MTPQNLLKKFRAKLDAHDQNAAAQMVRAYHQSILDINGELKEILQQIADDRAAGLITPTKWISRQKVLDRLKSQVAIELTKFGNEASLLLSSAQKHSIIDALQDTSAFVEAQDRSLSISFDYVYNEAIKNVVGLADNGAPIHTLFHNISTTTADQAADILSAGIATGRNTRIITNQLQNALGTSLNRALTISRTEIHRAYREASRASYEAAGKDVIEGWVWSSYLDACPMCQALSGTFHASKESFATHPRCRCIMVPKVKGSKLEIPNGIDRFGALPDDKKAEVMPPALFKLYKAGDIDLKDTVTLTNNKQWGRGARTATGKEALQHHQDQAARAKLFKYPAPAPGAAVGPAAGPKRPTVKADPLADGMAAARRTEDTIRKQRYETAYVYAPDGSLIFAKDGAQYEVRFSDAEIKKMKGNVFTHNHPRGWDYAASDPRRQGNSFSDDDLSLSCNGQLAEMRAVTPTHRYTIRPPQNQMWDMDYWTNTLGPAYRKYDAEVSAEFWKEIRAGRLSVEEAGANHYHAVWTRVSNDLGLRYTKEQS